MRIFELITTIFLLLFIVIRIIQKNSHNRIYEIAILPIFVLQIVLEGARWQMYGIYLIGILLVLINVSYFFNKKKVFLLKKRWMSILVITIILLSALLLYIFPVKDLKDVTCEYKISTMSYDITDKTRQEIYGDQIGQNRKIRVQLWYPTNDDVSTEKAMWIEDGLVVLRGLMKSFRLPFFLYDHITLIKSNSYINAPLNNEIKKMPVVVISHGWSGFRNLHTDLGELFASKGYLAISIDHTYGSVGMAFDDGKVAYIDRKALPDRNETDEFISYAEKLVDTYSKDTRAVIEHLEYLNNNSDIFKNHVNLDKIGVIGHSTGGGGVVKEAINSNKIDVVIGLDPWVEPVMENVLSKGLEQPALFFRSTSWRGGINEEYIKILTDNDRNNISIYEILGTNHQDLTMLYQLGIAPKLVGISSRLDGYLVSEILNSFILNFMNHHLLEEDDDIESLLDKYELVFEVY